MTAPDSLQAAQIAAANKDRLRLIEAADVAPVGYRHDAQDRAKRATLEALKAELGK